MESTDTRSIPTRRPIRLACSQIRDCFDACEISYQDLNRRRHPIVRDGRNTKVRSDADHERELARLNTEFWAQGNFVKRYASTDLRAVESMLLQRHRETFSGRVLELGCGAGRLTGHLCELAREVHGVDLSAAMVEYCRRTYPGATFIEGDMRDLSLFQSASYDVVLAPFNVLDVFGDAERRRVLEEIVRMLTLGGLLVMSSHNRGYAPFIRKPTQLATDSPRRLAVSLVRLPRRMRNRRRLLPLERLGADYAILNDSGNDYSMLHYYISRDAQECQLVDQGFELLECFDLDGYPVNAGAAAAHCPELHYVARKAHAPALGTQRF